MTGRVEYTLLLPYARPPLTLNRHLHYMAENAARQRLKWDAHMIARAARLPTFRAVTAELVWFKGDNRAADSDNISPTLKPIMDGVVSAGCLPDDNARHVISTTTRVVLRRDDPDPAHGPRLVLRLQDVSLTVADEPVPPDRT